MHHFVFYFPYLHPLSPPPLSPSLPFLCLSTPLSSSPSHFPSSPYPTTPPLLASLPLPGFVYRGHLVPLRARLLEGAAAAQVTPLPGDLPGTIYVAIDPAGERAWLTTLTLEETRTTALRAAGRPLVLQARFGTHSAPGRDPAVPEYPAMKGLTKSPLESARDQRR